ncbi:hypothetical protein T492DRAFT_878436, partial [Pavlovales sp. CCMP2436]
GGLRALFGELGVGWGDGADEFGLVGWNGADLPVWAPAAAYMARGHMASPPSSRREPKRRLLGERAHGRRRDHAGASASESESPNARSRFREAAHDEGKRRRTSAGGRLLDGDAAPGSGAASPESAERARAGAFAFRHLPPRPAKSFSSSSESESDSSDESGALDFARPHDGRAGPANGNGRRVAPKPVFAVELSPGIYSAGHLAHILPGTTFEDRRLLHDAPEKYLHLTLLRH